MLLLVIPAAAASGYALLWQAPDGHWLNVVYWSMVGAQVIVGAVAVTVAVTRAVSIPRESNRPVAAAR